MSSKAKQLQEIMRRIEEIPVASVDQIIQEKGLLFRLRRAWLKSVAETIYSLIDIAEQRGREEAQTVEKLYTDLVDKLHKQKRCLNCGRKLIEVEDPIKK